MRASRLAAGLAAAAVLAGCASEPPEQPGTTSDAPAGHGSLADCLSDHGVPAAPGPGGGPPSGVDPGAWREAMQSCASFAPGPAN